MSLLFMDGFDHYATADRLLKWDAYDNGPVLDNAYTRFGVGQSVRLDSANALYKNVANCATFIFGGAYYEFFGLSSGTILKFQDSTTNHLYITRNADMTISAYNGAATLLGTSSLTITPTAWNYIEVKATIHDTTGTVEVRVNGVVFLNLTGKDTKNTANAYITRFALFSFYTQTRWDDVYFCDTAGSAPMNDFIGDVRITTVYPNSDGTNVDFTPSTGATDYGVVDEAQHNADTDYLYSSTLNARETLNVTDVSIGSGTIYAVQENIVARKDDAGARSIKPTVKSGATYSLGTEVALSTTYTFIRQLHETDPNTSAAWTAANLNAAEFGLDLTV